MKTRNGMTISAGLLALAALVPLTGNAEAILHGRVSFDTGGALIKGVEESDWSNASVNTLVLPEDTLWVDNGGSAEVEFSGGTFLRMADGSKAEVASLPPSGVIRGWIGSFYIHRVARSQGDFVFQTPAGFVEVASDSMVRIDIVSEGITTVSTRWGQATVRTDAGGNVQAHAGKRVYIETGLLPSEPTPYDRTAEDAFDRWNRERAEYLATGTTQPPVEVSNDTLGVSDLGRYGEWVTIDSRPYWRPTVVVDYTPYRYGYWNNVGRVGNVWVGNYPFCYVTSHYGYWDYTPRYGWVWGYDRVWSPAWAATVRYGDYFVWAPVNRYYRPVYPTTSAYFSIGGVSFGYFGTSCVRVSDLYLGPTYVHYANYEPFRRYYGSTTNVTVNIWNINTGGRRPHVQVPFNNSVTTVRDYTPRRSIRGATSLFASSRSASERVQRLESTSGRGTFSRSTRTGSEFVRTDSARIDQGNRTRNVQLTDGAPDYTRASRSNPVVATSERSRGDAVALGSVRDRQSGTRGATPAARGDDTSRSGVTERGTRTSTAPALTGSEPRSRTNDRGATSGTTATPRRTDIDPGFDNDPLGTHTRPATRTRTPQGSDVSPQATEAPRARTAVPAEAGRSTTRSTTRTTADTPRVTETPRTRTETPAATGRTTTRSTADTSRTEVRTTARERSTSTAAPRSQTPDRSRTETPYTAPGASNTTGLRSVAPDNTPRLNPLPPTRTRSGEVSQPVIRQQRAPETRSSVSAPAASRQPSTSSRSYTAPSRESSPRVSAPAPSRESSPRVSAPAPSRESSPRVSAPAPSRQPSTSSRSYTAPSRDTSGSRGDVGGRAPATRGR